jgi:hypothetical protein
VSVKRESKKKGVRVCIIGFSFFRATLHLDISVQKDGDINITKVNMC